MATLPDIPAKRHADCVVLSPPGVEPDPELLAALDRRELTVRHAGLGERPKTSSAGEFAAMAQVCSLMKATVADVRAGREARGVILLLVEPTRLDKAPDLVHAIERYAPHAAVWCYQRDSSPRMRPVTPKDVADWLDADVTEFRSPATARPAAKPRPASAPPATTASEAQASTRPNLDGVRLGTTTGQVLPDHGLSPEFHEPWKSGQTRKDREPLSQAELAMLLADEPSIDHNGTNGHGEAYAGRTGKPLADGFGKGGPGA